MEEFKLTSKNEAEAIKKAVVCLRKGGILLYPTDTCYGLAAIFLMKPLSGSCIN